MKVRSKVKVGINVMVEKDIATQLIGEKKSTGLCRMTPDDSIELRFKTPQVLEKDGLLHTLKLEQHVFVKGVETFNFLTVFRTEKET